METNEFRSTGKYLIGKDNTRIWYRFNNLNSEEVTVFIHGLGGSSYPFEKFCNIFNENNISNLVVDLRGHGFSGKSPLNNYQFNNYVEDLENIFKNEGINKVNLVGHCFGGMITMRMLETYPDIINSVCLISTNHKPNAAIRSSIIKEFLSLTQDVLPKLIPDIYTRKVNQEFDYSEFHKENDLYLPRMLEDFRDTSIEVMIRTLETIFEGNFERILRKTNKPVLIVHGKKDTIFSYKIAQDMHEIISDSRLIISDTDNHVTHIIDPDSKLPEIILSYVLGH